MAVDRRHEQSPPAECTGAGLGASSVDLAAALGELDRATRDITERLGALRGPQPAVAPPPDSTSAPSGADGFEARMREAEREAEAYLEHAKRRADSLVNAMVGAVEREAAEMRREAAAGIRTRWQAVEVDAARHVEEARRVADRIVAERQQRIAALSDGIADRAQALTAGMEDAQRVREQFELFVRALSRAAERIASTREIGGVADRDPGGPEAAAA